MSIMKFSEGSILRQYEREFEAYGIHAKFHDSAIEKVAELAEKENTGARALMTVLAKILRDFKFELPGTSITELTIDADLIENHDSVIEKYRAEGLKVNLDKVKQEIKSFAKEFKTMHGMKMEFSDEAILTLAELSSLQGRSVLQICKSKFKDYQFGLKLIHGNTGQNEFILSKEAIEDADKFLSNMLVQSYDAAKKTNEETSEDESE